MSEQLKNWKPGFITALPAGYSERTQYTNIAVTPEGHLRPWPGIGTTFNPPVLRSDGQVTWLPGEHNASHKASPKLTKRKEL